MLPTKLLSGAVVVCAVLTCVTGDTVVAQETAAPAESIESFAGQWDESLWRPEPRQYMRPLDDDDWKARMRTMHRLVSAGKNAVEPLIEALQSDDVPTRILAAQTLGYLAPDVPNEPLLEALKQESNSAVQLYLIDSLGMQGQQDLKDVLGPMSERLDNQDVRKHISYAIERGAKGLESGIRQSLAEWDPATIDTAQIGKLAPDFELTDVNGKRIRLSDFRGKKSVILVFIYGDT